MSDVEDTHFGGRGSRSPSKSDCGSPVRVKPESRSGSGSPSRASKRSESRSKSRSKSRSRSRKHSHRRYSRSRSRSHSHRKKSRSRSYSPECRRKKSRSTSPMSSRRRHAGSRTRFSNDIKKESSNHSDARLFHQANPDPNTCLGVFGLSLYTTERDLREVFSRYGPLAGVNVVYDQRTGRSRGFSFVYFERIDDAKEAMERANGMELDGRRIRVDYSITKRAHTPTPGIYMGRPTHNGSSSSGGGGGSSGGSGGRRRDSYNDRGGYDRGGYDRGGYDRYDEYDNRYSRRRSPSPYYSRCRSRSRSRSYSPRRY
ncbi:transformer-2 protein homolog alpha-like isoform X2 [Polyodon spathula]|uniref:transformer-2 protein homolog alpha-like isoform X2 n=1 Tax=Polyodon spathula TaxID=7913 RepID=UPI001B7EB77E|nr:transformer-2 protein homolog alpha-like isoform X2 [Polyodon spathula]